MELGARGAALTALYFNDLCSKKEEGEPIGSKRSVRLSGKCRVRRSSKWREGRSSKRREGQSSKRSVRLLSGEVVSA